jgi:putrescine transport system substrate-binding protein
MVWAGLLAGCGAGKYDVFDSSEVLMTRLLTGNSGYDVVVPSGAATYRLIQAGVLKKLDVPKLKNRGNLDPSIMHMVAANDPGNEHAVPYLRGTTGIGYNPDLVEKALGARMIDSLSAVFDPAVAAPDCGSPRATALAKAARPLR